MTFAEGIKSTVEAYGGQEKPRNDSILPLLYNVMSIGYLVAVITFVMEFFRPSTLLAGDALKRTERLKQGKA